MAFMPNIITNHAITYTNDTQRSFVFSYHDFRVYFACYPPESFKIICLTCIWLKFVDTSFHSSQKPPQISAASVAILNRWEALNFLWAKSANVGAIRSSAIFCDFFVIVPELTKFAASGDKDYFV